MSHDNSRSSVEMDISISHNILKSMTKEDINKMLKTIEFQAYHIIDDN